MAIKNYWVLAWNEKAPIAQGGKVWLKGIVDGELQLVNDVRGAAKFLERGIAVQVAADLERQEVPGMPKPLIVTQSIPKKDQDKQLRNTWPECNQPEKEEEKGEKENGSDGNA